MSSGSDGRLRAAALSQEEGDRIAEAVLLLVTGLRAMQFEPDPARRPIPRQRPCRRRTGPMSHPARTIATDRPTGTETPTT